MRSTDRTRATSDAWSMGFVRYSSAPASSPATTSLVSDLDVTRMMGMNGRVASPLMRRHTSTPSSLGIITSSKIRSGWSRRPAASASSPSPACNSSYPCALSRTSRMSRLVSLSSTMRIRCGSYIAMPMSFGAQPIRDLRQILPDRRQELTRTERLGEVGIAARLACFALVAAQRIRCDHDDRDRAQRRIGLEPAGRLVAVEDRQLNVHEDQVGPLRRRGGAADRKEHTSEIQ